MKKTVFILLFVLSFSFINANPLPTPPMISEIYFDSTGWFIELDYSFYFGNDSIRLISISDTAYLSRGQYGTGYIKIVTQDSIMSLFQINRVGDRIKLERYIAGDWYLSEEICWGNCTCNSPFNCDVNSPSIGQSLEMQSIEYNGSPLEFWLTKTNIPSLGVTGYPSNAEGTFCGYVHDHAGNPVSNILLRYWSDYAYTSLYHVITDTNGYFSGNIFAKNYNIRFSSPSSPLYIIVDTSVYITIEPDSINYYEFILDTLLTGIIMNPFQIDYSLSTFPNPTTGETTISFKVPENFHHSKALVKTYNINGEIISIQAVNTSDHKEKYSVKWNVVTDIPSGTYFCKLEIDGMKVATTKIILTK